MRLTFRQRSDWVAHVLKAGFQQHHRELIPLFAPHIAEDAVIVDVGAHAGQFARLFEGRDEVAQRSVGGHEAGLNGTWPAGATPHLAASSRRRRNFDNLPEKGPRCAGCPAWPPRMRACRGGVPR